MKAQFLVLLHRSKTFLHIWKLSTQSVTTLPIAPLMGRYPRKKSTCQAVRAGKSFVSMVAAMRQSRPRTYSHTTKTVMVGKSATMGRMDTSTRSNPELRLTIVGIDLILS